MSLLSSYPQGFNNGIQIRGVPLMQTHPGKAWWLSNATTLLKGQRGGSDGNKGTFDSPFSTLAGAMTAISADSGASRGDVLFVKPGHAESISAATALSIAGVAVIGLGLGTNRPTFTLDTLNTSALAIGADNIAFQNCRFVANFLSIAACFTVGSAKWFSVENCDFLDTDSTHNFLNIVKTTGGANTADGLLFNDNNVKNLGVTSNNTTILSANTIDRLTALRNNLDWAVQNDKAILAIISAGILTRLDCGWNKGYRPNTTTAGGSLITVTGTTSTGWVYNNYVQTLQTGTDLLFTTSVGLGAFENRVSGVVGATGFVIPAVDS